MKHFLPVFLAVALFSCHHDRNLSLRLHYHKAQIFDIKYRQYSYENYDENNLIQNDYIRLGLSVDSVTPDSSYIFKVKIDYVRVKDGGFNGQEFSSDQNPELMSPMQRSLYNQFKPVLDSTYTFAIDKRGQVIKPFSFAHSNLKIAPELSLLDLGVYQIVFPKENVGFGDEWKEEQPNELLQTMKTSNYELESMPEGKIQIRLTGDIRHGDKSYDFSGLYQLDKVSKALISTEIKLKIGSLTKVTSIEVN